MTTGLVEAIYKLYYFLSMKKTQGKSEEHRENAENFVLIGAWQP